MVPRDQNEVVKKNVNPKRKKWYQETFGDFPISISKRPKKQYRDLNKDVTMENNERSYMSTLRVKSILRCEEWGRLFHENKERKLFMSVTYAS